MHKHGEFQYSLADAALKEAVARSERMRQKAGEWHD
jgi:hypothetical protein